jgi:RNA polymerase sigma-70 factor (ECF subfamily)
MPPHEVPEKSQWFAAKLQPHEPMLRAWLRSRFRQACDVDDIVQEAYARVLQAREHVAIEPPKAFLFATLGISSLAGFGIKR